MLIMKIVNHKILTSALLALLFSVAVSGGCGGGSSGHYYGDYGNSSHDVEPEVVSPDVAQPMPEAPALSDQFGTENGDDEYGAGKVNSFMLLNKTTWKINGIQINTNSFSQRTCNVSDDYNYKTKTVTFLVTGNSMAWATDYDKKTPHYDNLTVEFQDPIREYSQRAPIVRPANNFYDKDDMDVTYEALVKNNGQETEDITIGGRFNNTHLVGKEVTIENKFTAEDGESYKCYLELSRVDNFSILDDTDWQIKSVQIVGDSGTSKDYRVTSYGDVDRITLFTEVENNVGTLDFKVNGKEIDTDFLTISFMDTYHRIPQFLSAPVLKPSYNFKSQGVIQEGNAAGYETFEAKMPDENLPEQYQDDERYKDREIMYISDYGPNGYVTINNSFYLKDNDGRLYYYWATLVLEPYNPNKK